ncbi:MAG TPA: butyrate kinase [Clostridiaceae bacterium]|nr:butyrate kinase [Clostridiaceae bacterium]
MSRFLIINPGSTSTKIGVYISGEFTMTRKIEHATEMGGPIFGPDQLAAREKMILDLLRNESIDLGSMDAIVARGGLLHPLKGGVYEVNQDMIDDLNTSRYGWHSCNLGALLADSIAKPYGLKSYIADPVIVDELQPLARISGWPEFERRSIFHALNHKAVGRKFAYGQGGKYEEYNLIIVHMGGGISIGVHEKGEVIDVNNAFNGEGPFSPERTGGLPVISVIEACFSGNFADAIDVKTSFVGKGGLLAYLGTNDAREVDRRIESGDEEARFILDAMAYQIAKEIGSAATVLKGEVDAILLTGGLAYDTYLVEWIIERVLFIAPVRVFPGEDELKALAQAVDEALGEKKPILKYSKEA